LKQQEYQPKLKSQKIGPPLRPFSSIYKEIFIFPAKNTVKKQDNWQMPLAETDRFRR
jgi:hypothetical protein